MIRGAVIAACLAPTATTALELQVPATARLMAEERTAPDSYDIPVAAFDDGVLPVETLEGRVTRRSWRIDAPGVTTLQLLTPLREQLQAEGYDRVFECEADSCGGFDFRFSTEVLEAPKMFVDLTDYRFLAARKDGGDVPVWMSLLVSRTDTIGFLQVIEVAPESTPVGTPVRQTLPQPQAAQTTSWMSELPGILETSGRIVLSDLAFPSGSASLAEGGYESLTALAEYLKSKPDRLVALVGHTDTTGSLNANIGLSKRRAQSVVSRLINRHGIPEAQITGEGMGYLAPLTTNLTEEGREANRRVEAILLSTE